MCAALVIETERFLPMSDQRHPMSITKLLNENDDSTLFHPCHIFFICVHTDYEPDQRPLFLKKLTPAESLIFV